MYENLKRVPKKCMKVEKDIFLPGGGSNASCTVATSAIHYALLEILGMTAVRNENPFDGSKPGNLHLFFVTVSFLFV